MVKWNNAVPKKEVERSKNIIRKKFELRRLLNKNDYTDTIVKITFKKIQINYY